MTIPVKPVAGPKENLKTMQVLMGALIIGISIFTVIVVFLLSVNGPFLENEPLVVSTVLLYIAIGLALGCYFFARVIYKRKVETVNNSAIPLNDRLNQYRTVLILYMACCEGPALFSLVALLFTENYWLLIITSSMMMAMAVKFPFTQKIISLLNTDWIEQQELI